MCQQESRAKAKVSARQQ